MVKFWATFFMQKGNYFVPFSHFRIKTVSQVCGERVCRSMRLKNPDLISAWWLPEFRSRIGLRRRFEIRKERNRPPHRANPAMSQSQQMIAEHVRFSRLDGIDGSRCKDNRLP